MCRIVELVPARNIAVSSANRPSYFLFFSLFLIVFTISIFAHMGFIVSQTTLECNRELVSRPASRRLLLSLVISLVSRLCNTASPLSPRACTCCTQPPCLTHKILWKRRLGNTKVVVKEAAQQPQQPEEVVNAIVSAAQTGVKTITVTTNFDATNSKVTLSKGSSAVEIATPNFSEDGKTITISTTANLVASTYTVKVDELTADVTAEASKVDKIEILSDKAALANKDGQGRYMGATVGYRVLNQFEDDITKTVSLTVNSSASSATLSPSAHLIKFTTNSSNGFMLGRDVIVVSLLDTTSGKNATANLTLSTEAYAAEMTFEGVYNVDGKTLTEDTNFANDPFYILLTAKDQYGNKYKEYKQIVENEDLYVSVMGGLTALTKYSNGSTNTHFIVLNKDGVDYLAYPVAWMGTMTPSAGTATVQVLSAGGGTCSGEIEVATGARVDSITVSQNGVIVAGEENELSFTALDANGNEVTAYKQLRQVEINGNTANYSLAFERNADGSAKLILDATAPGAIVKKDQTAMQSFTFQTLNHKFSTALLTISENARPVAIDGLRDVDTSISTNTSMVDIKVKNLVVEDQYGRILSAGKVADMIKKGTGMYNLREVTATIPKNSVLKVSGSALTAQGGTYAVAVSGSAASITKNSVLFQVSPQNKGTETVSFQIYNNGANQQEMLADASVDVNFTIKDTTSATTATATVDPIYVATGGALTSVRSAYKQAVKVKVGGALLSQSDYTVDVPGGMTVVADTVDHTNVWAVYSSDDQDDIKEFKDQTATTLTRTLTITLNGTGEKFTVDATIDRTAPKITTVDGLTGKFTPVNGDTINLAYLLGSASPKLSADWIADQYGKGVTVDANGVYTLADGTTVTPSLTFVPTVALGEGAGAPTDLKDNNKGTASMTVNTGFAGAGLTINFGGTTANVKILGF